MIHSRACSSIVASLLFALALPLQAGTVTLTGEGVVNYTPDAVHFSLSTETRADSASAARSESNKRVAAWEKAVADLRERLQNYDDSQVTVTEVAEYDDNGRPTDQRFFLANQIVRFDLTDLSLLNQVIAAAEKANLSYGLSQDSYFPTRTAELENAALAAAIDDAKTRCQFIALRLESQCGKVENLRVFDQGQHPRPMMMSMDARKETVGQIGEREIRAGVEATFQLD